MKTNFYDAIIVLGGGRNDKGLTLLSTMRLDKAWELFQQGKAAKILTLGGPYSTYAKDAICYNDTGAQVRANYLLSKGNINNENIIMVEDGRDTIHEAFASRKRAREKGIKNILLVTSDKHMKRALFVFQRIFGEDFNIVGNQDTWTETGDILLDAEEEAYLKLWKAVFDRLPIEIPNPKDWNEWYEQNLETYKQQLKLHDEFHPPGGKESQAYTRSYKRK